MFGEKCKLIFARRLKTIETFEVQAYIKEMTTEKHSLIGLSLEDMTSWALSVGLRPFRAQQIYHWVYGLGVRSFDQMKNLPKNVQETLAETFHLDRLDLNTAQTSVDGTQKWLLSLKDGQEIETVHIPERTRGTLCISSQVGCTLTCKFCHTGTQLLVRNLTAAELLGQMFMARDVFGEWPAPQENRHVSNIVLMGMGEPLYNYENVKKALAIAMDPAGFNMPKRSITLSTSGVVPFIEQCGKELGVNLAISLHAVTNELRNRIMPINRKYSLEELMAACQAYPGTSKSNRITFEYVMLKGVNDSLADARGLVKLLKNIHAKINLIPFNSWPEAPYECSDWQTIEKFAAVLEEAGYASPIRKTRGEDILAACGQLKSLSMRQKKSKL
ncbi:MAG: 23S rRNA (adenine(2503)-C(2))-methyltransferase RlmN [Alphaproteobacteria bacterium]